MNGHLRKHRSKNMFKNVSETEYEFKSTVNQNHLNAAGITHGGYIASIIDAGAGTAAHRSANKLPCVTIALDIKFVGIKLSFERNSMSKLDMKQFC